MMRPIPKVKEESEGKTLRRRQVCRRVDVEEAIGRDIKHERVQSEHRIDRPPAHRHLHTGLKPRHQRLQPPGRPDHRAPLGARERAQRLSRYQRQVHRYHNDGPPARTLQRRAHSRERVARLLGLQPHRHVERGQHSRRLRRHRDLVEPARAQRLHRPRHQRPPGEQRRRLRPAHPPPRAAGEDDAHRRQRRPWP